MKISKNRLKEIIQEELEMVSMEDNTSGEQCGQDGEYDQEGYMTKSQLYKIGEYAMELHDMIEDSDNLPEWMQSKVSQISQMIGDIKHALEYDQEEGDYDEHQPDSEDEYSDYDNEDEDENLLVDENDY